VDNRVGNPQSSGFGHFLDAMGVKIRIVKSAGVLGAAFSLQHVVDDSDQFVVAFIKKKSRDFIVHNRTMIRTRYIELGLSKIQDCSFADI
jgi:hypothetical protein